MAIQWTLPPAIANIEWTRLNQLRLAWSVTQAIAAALVILTIAASVAASQIQSASTQFQLVWYILTVFTWSAFSSIVLLVNVPWINIDPSIAFGALSASTTFLITVTIAECVRWAALPLAAATSVSVFSALTAICLTVDLVGFIQFKDDLIGDSGTMEAPNVIATIPSQIKHKDYYNQQVEQA